MGSLKADKAFIVALEPESYNYALLTKNAKTYKNIHPINAGLWSHKGFLQIQNPDAATWSFQVTEAAGDEGRRQKHDRERTTRHTRGVPAELYGRGGNGCVGNKGGRRK